MAVLDDGIQNNHPFLSGGIVSEACYSTHNPGQNYYSLCPGSVTASTATGMSSAAMSSMLEKRAEEFAFLVSAEQGKILAEGSMDQVQNDPKVIDVYLGH